MAKFDGVIGTTIADSTPWWPNTTGMADGPNVISIIFDDAGWSDFGCFGSEIATPNIDALAANGLRYSNFHVTPLCSPTRAAFFSGRNHHSIGMRCLSDTDTGFPNSRGCVEPSVALLPQMMREEGYGTYMVGKWHLTPAQEITPAGPYNNWPLAKGFDRFYGFLGGCTDQYTPELVLDNNTIVPPNDDGYHLSSDLCDRAIGYLRDHTAFRKHAPFFLNVGFGAPHAPIQVPKRYIDPYVAVFGKGWDATRADRLDRQKALGLVPANTQLTPNNPDVPAWATLSDSEKTVFTRLQSAYAGFVQHTDEQIGRLVGELKRLNLFENTIILVFSDNGAAREGGRNGAIDCNAAYSKNSETIDYMMSRLDDIGGKSSPAHYPEGWAMAGNTPFRRYKQYVELGGVRSPLVVSWPNGIETKGDIRNQFLHVIDLAPTLLDLIGRKEAPHFDGASFRDTLKTADAAAPRKVQYWEMFGRRSLYHDGWKAISQHEKGDPYEEDVWRLYNTENDFSESTDLAAQYPDKLKFMQDAWWTEAQANHVMPLDDRTLVDIIVFRQPNGLMSEREITLYAGQGHISQPSMITSSERAMEIRAHFNGSVGEQEGVLISTGDNIGGYTLYIKSGQLTFEHISCGVYCKFSGPISPLTTSCALRWEPDELGGAKGRLLTDGTVIAEGHTERVTRHLSFWGMDVGRDDGSPVSMAYEAPFMFNDAGLDRVVITFFEDLDPESIAATMESTE